MELNVNYEKIYYELLEYFHIDTKITDNITDGNYVTIDHIHNAIIETDLKMNQPLKHYIIKAKQEFLNEQKLNTRKNQIINNNIDKLIHTIEPLKVYEYGFNNIELKVIYIKLNGLNIRSLNLKWNTYLSILDNIKKKIEYK